MNQSIKFSLLFFCLFSFTGLLAATTNQYQKMYLDVQEAIEAKDFKSARSIVKSLLPIIDSDISYTEEILSEEEDEYFVNDLNKKLARQKEIREKLQGFVKTKNSEKYLSNESMNMIRELRRLSMKPQSR